MFPPFPSHPRKPKGFAKNSTRLTPAAPRAKIIQPMASMTYVLQSFIVTQRILEKWMKPCSQLKHVVGRGAPFNPDSSLPTGAFVPSHAEETEVQRILQLRSLVQEEAAPGWDVGLA